MTAAEKRRAEFYHFCVDDVNGKPRPHRAKRKIAVDLWLELAEAGAVKPYVGALHGFASAHGPHATSLGQCNEDVLDATIKALEAMKRRVVAQRHGLRAPR